MIDKWWYPTDPWPDYPISNCCGARIIDETDLCSRCKEHADIDYPHGEGGEVDDDNYTEVEL